MLNTFSTTKRIVISGYLALGIFLLAQTVHASVAEPAAAPQEAAKKLALIGTVFGPQGGTMAILEDLSTKNQSLYRLGDQLRTVGVLSAIEKDRVLFREGQQEEWLPLALIQQNQSGAPGQSSFQRPPSPNGPSRRVVDRRDIEAALADPTRLHVNTQAVPNLKNGKLDGFRLAVVPLSFYYNLGLRSNDVLQKINGVEVQDPGIVLSLSQQLRSERTVHVDLVRDSRPQTLTYDIR
jgi:general secretion pathway protein C